MFSRHATWINFFLILILTACTPAASVASTLTVTSPIASPQSEATGTRIPVPPATTPASTYVTLVGRWLGGYQRADGSHLSFIIAVESDSDGSFTLEPQIQARPFTTFNIQADELQFTLTGTKADDFQSLQFIGRWLAGEKIVGTLTEAGTAYEVILNRLVEAVSAEDYVGVYSFPSGRVMTLLPHGGFTFQNLVYFAGDMTYVDFESGALRGVYAVAPDSFLVGGARGMGYPFAAQITFDRNGSTAVAGLIWRTLDPLTEQQVGEAEQGTRQTLRVEPVTFTSADGTTLAGQLTFPNSPGPYPVFVMLHGSERGRRNGFGQQLLGAFMATHGFALLSYDKRGVGDSGGTYREAPDASNLQHLAQDAVAGAEYLQTRADIDPAHIGLIGASQAGWVIPLAAQSSAVDLFVILSGPVVSVGHEDYYSALTNDGESPTRYTSEEISKQLAAFPPSGFDPVPVIATLTQPGLWLWGDQDKSLPVPESVANLQQLIESGKTNFSYTLFPNADHSLQQSPRGLLAEMPYSPGFPTHYYLTLTQWLRQHTASVSLNAASSNPPSATPTARPVPTLALSTPSPTLTAIPLPSLTATPVTPQLVRLTAQPNPVNAGEIVLIQREVLGAEGGLAPIG